jgi:hypothetical protein
MLPVGPIHQVELGVTNLAVTSGFFELFGFVRHGNVMRSDPGASLLLVVVDADQTGAQGLATDRTCTCTS